jgi:hypothetical protein
MQSLTNDRLLLEEEANAKVLSEMLEEFELEENELAQPAYPERVRGGRRDQQSYLPCDAERVELRGFVLPEREQQQKIRVTSEGVLEDMFHPEGEDVVKSKFGFWTPRTEVYKARPLPLRCEKCDVECDSYASFTEHCILPTHKVLLDPSRRFDPRFLDPRYNDPRHAGDSFEALSATSKLEAMRRYKQDMVDWFVESCPSGPNDDKKAWDNMKSQAKEVRWNVTGQADSFGLSKKQLRAVLRKCTPDRAFDIWLGTVLSDFEEQGMNGFPLDVVQHGWGELCYHGSSSWLNFLAGMTGLDY